MKDLVNWTFQTMKRLTWEMDIYLNPLHIFSWRYIYNIFLRLLLLHKPPPPHLVKLKKKREKMKNFSQMSWHISMLNGYSPEIPACMVYSFQNKHQIHSLYVTGTHKKCRFAYRKKQQQQKKFFLLTGVWIKKTSWKSHFGNVKEN